MIGYFLLSNLLILTIIGFLSLFAYPGVGIYIDSLVIVFLIFAALYDIFDLYAEELISLVAVIPLLGLISFIIPFSNPFFFSISIHIVLFITAAFYEIFLVKNSFQNISIRSFTPSFVAGIALLFFLLFISNIKPFPYHVYELSPIAIMVLIVESGIEVLYFQGLLQNQIQRFTNTFSSIIFTSLFFTIFHFNANILHTLFYLEFEIVLSSIYAYRKDIYSTIFLQAVVAIGLFLITQSILL